MIFRRAEATFVLLCLGAGFAVAQAASQGVTISLKNEVLATPDPVDGASGQFFESDIDFKLGGPTRLSFSRFYASRLPVNGVTSLGPGWMSNLDVAAVISGTGAEIVLFGGKVVTFANSNNVWQLTSPLDTDYQFAPVPIGYQLMDPSSRLIYTFTPGGTLVSIQDRNGNTITLTPGPNGPTSATDGVGRTLTLTYSNGQLSQVQDQAGRTVQFGYAGNQLTSVTDPLNNTTQYSYTNAGLLTGLLTKKQFPSGVVPVTQTYDSSGRVVSQTDGNKNVTKIAYDGNGGTTVTDAFNNVTKQVNDSNGDLTQLTDPNGGTAKLTYDSAFHRTSVSDKVGNKMTYTYHAPSGYVASATDPLGNTTTYSYTAQIQGGFTFYNMTGIAYADGSSITLNYDPHGNRISMVQQDGTTVFNAFDSSGRLTGITDAAQQTTTYTYNADGTLGTITDALGNVTSNTYDVAKRLATVTAAKRCGDEVCLRRERSRPDANRSHQCVQQHDLRC